MDDVLAQVAEIFAQEVEEQATRIASALMTMAAEPVRLPALIEDLFRDAHSLKGSSASLGLTELEHLAHLVEGVLTPVRRQEAAITPALVAIGLRAMDAARARAAGIAARTERGRDEVAQVSAELERLLGQADDEPDPATVDVGERSGVTTPAGEGGTVEPVAAGVRVTEAQLARIERHVDELRKLRGRLADHVGTLGLLGQVAAQMAIASPVAAGLVRQLAALRRELTADVEAAQRGGLDVDEGLRAMRMVPASMLRDPLQRALHEASLQTGKAARLSWSSGDTRVDRQVLELLKHPLLHLVRNALDHGVESGEVREAIGKPSVAAVSVQIRQRGSRLVVEVSDDGRGLDLERVRAKAVERGDYTASEAAALSETALHDLLFRAGFSTAAEVTKLSGRGVGLDVVREAVVRLHGRVEVRTRIGAGTTFELQVPLTIAAAEMMMFSCAGRSYGIALGAIERVLRLPAHELPKGAHRVLRLGDDEPLPVVHLAHLLGTTERVSAEHVTLACVAWEARRVALVVDAIEGVRELVLQPLPLELRGLGLLDSGAILANGQPVLILSPAQVVAATARPAPARVATGRARTILVAEDTATTRSILRLALEGLGHRVLTVGDGEDALRVLGTESIDILLSDVRMPRVDGFELTARVRADARIASLPVVLFSSLARDEDRQRGTACGADVYLTKSAFDRGHLLDVVAQLLEERA